VTPAQVTVGDRVLVAITEIDGCGKGYVTTWIVDKLRAKGVRAAAITIDGWLNLPSKRFDVSNPAEHFYLHAIRFEEMFAQLVLPLRDRRSLRLEADYTEETTTEYRRHTYEFEDIDVIALEGVYLLKAPFNSITTCHTGSNAASTRRWSAPQLERRKDYHRRRPFAHTGQSAFPRRRFISNETTRKLQPRCS